jgi:hypothetical protein
MRLIWFASRRTCSNSILGERSIAGTLRSTTRSATPHKRGLSARPGSIGLLISRARKMPSEIGELIAAYRLTFPRGSNSGEDHARGSGAAA